MKIRTESQLQDYLDEEISWRKKEIFTLRSLVKKNKSANKTLMRSGVAILYAHWEGFIKRAAEAYLNFVSNQGLTYQSLKTCFAVLGFKREVQEIASSKQMESNVQLFDFIRSKLTDRAQLSFEGAIRTDSNLSSKVFKNIISTIGFSYSHYASKAALIDNELLDRRNNIAHGNYLDLDEESWMRLSDEVLKLIDGFKTDVENATVLKSYRRNLTKGEEG